MGRVSMRDEGRVRAVGFSLAARPLFWLSDHAAALRAPRIYAGYRCLRREARGLRWVDYATVAAARAAGIDLQSSTWGETPFSLARAWLNDAGVGSDSRVLDLGAGIGTVLLAARALGAAARGVELSPSRVACGRQAMALVGAALDEGDARTVSLADPWRPTHIVLCWTTWAPTLRDAVSRRLAALPPGSRVLSTTHLPSGPFAVVRRRWRTTPSGRIEHILSVREEGRSYSDAAAAASALP